LTSLTAKLKLEWYRASINKKDASFQKMRELCKSFLYSCNNCE